MEQPFYTDQLKNHVLEPVIESGPIKAYYLRRPGGGRMMSTLITFSPEGISITGDLTPEQRGTCSVLGYGLDWFAGLNGADYLCSKFLTKKWRCSHAIREMDWRIGADADESTQWKAVKAELQNTLGLDDFDAHDLYDLMNKHDIDTSDGVPGMDYIEEERGWLVAIQLTFARLWNDKEAKP